MNKSFLPEIQRLHRLLSLLMVLSASGPVGATVAEHRSPRRSDCIAVESAEGGSPLIAARVNNQGPFTFVLDTGSSGTTLDKRRVRQLRLAPSPFSEQGQGMSGPVEVLVFRVRSVSAGPLRIRETDVAGVAAPQLEHHDIAGLAGVDLFSSQLAVWRLDRGCVQVRPSGARPDGRGWERIASRWLKPWKILIPVKIGSVGGWGLLDTGSQQTILPPGFARLIGLAGETLRSGSTIAGVDGRGTALSTFTLATATVGRWRFTQPRASVASLPLFERLGGPGEPLAIIGMDWIKRRRFAIDYGKQLIWQALP